MSLEFYDQVGAPVAYADDLEHIYAFSGEPVAYIQNDSIYDYGGRHLGWFFGGWVLDHNGNHVYFTDQAIGGPLKPLRMLRPLKGLKSLKPLKGIKAIKPIRPIRSLSWSNLMGLNFFEHG